MTRYLVPAALLFWAGFKLGRAAVARLLDTNPAKWAAA